MVWQAMGAGLSIAGGITSARARRRAEEAARKQALENRRIIAEASEEAATQIQAGAKPLLAQAVGLDRASRFRDPMVEQGLVAGLRQQAGAQAAQDRQVGRGDRRGAVVGQLLRGQGLLAAESQRIQRFTQLSQMAAGLRGQSAQIMGQAAQARMQGAITMAGIDIPQSSYSPLGVGLTALGQGLSDLDTDTDTDTDTENATLDPNWLVATPDVIAPDPLPDPSPHVSPPLPLGPLSLEEEPSFDIPYGSPSMGSRGDNRRGGPTVPHLRLDASRSPIGRETYDVTGLGPQFGPPYEESWFKPSTYSPTDPRVGTSRFGKMWDPITQTYRR